MQNLDWGDVRYFLEVVRAGSVSQAAQRLSVNQTTVSRRISALEDTLNKKLFERSGNGWVLTPVGERLVASAENMAEEAHTIERQVMADSHELRGKLRVTVPDSCTQFLVMPALLSFTQRYPDVDLEIIATRTVLDLAAREADVALRTTDEPPPNLVGKRVAQIGYAIFGTREILAAVESDAYDGDVPCITWIGDGATRPPWVEKSFPKTRRLYRTSELGVMAEMAHLGIGMAQMPCVLGDRDPLLHRIPARYVEPGWGLWVLSHVDLRTTARVRIFKDLLVEALEKQKDLIEGRQRPAA
jgi:DNA-binding transcriptional LysR family regulator